jgi:enamine deaminase RidA (YjgF/YER057c/UK114 family)
MIRRSGTSKILSTYVVANGVVYVAGITPRDCSVGVTAQTADILTQIDAILTEAGSDKSKILNANIWLRDIATFAEMNAAWTDWADPNALPARATVEAKLARDDILVEIMVQALA